MVFVDHRGESKEAKTVALPGNTLTESLRVPAHELRVMPSLASFPGTALVRSSMVKEMQFVVGASYQIATTSGGFGPYTSVTNDLLSTLADFVSLAALFDEFFIKSFKLVYQPASRYQKPSGTEPALYADFPLHVASIQHGAPLYATHSDAANNAGLLICNTADPWTYTWKNTESKRSTVLPDPSTSSVVPTQGWCLTRPDNASAYTGAAQILAPGALTATSSSVALGTVTVRWDLAFRSRK